MIEMLLLPALLGALFSALLCGAFRYFNRRPQGGVVLASALMAGIGYLILGFGAKLFSAPFWTHGLKGGSAFVMVVVLFILSTAAGILSASAVVRFHRYRIESAEAHARHFPRQPRTSKN